ncbi:hypothetical protein ACFYNO_38095 [Kitasatospora sp. NPDC006697]|uniref:hypothetical protein n=1 Tax=Kitasatospora sp. NPDC006697 TaxID=3364020 RepID=UPI0036BB1717
MNEPAGAVTEPLPSPRPVRTSRTVLLLVAALVLGPAIGGGIGYRIQASRPAEALPPLVPTALPAYPVGALDPKAVTTPKPLPIDGDLRKLLLPKPDGAQDWDDFNYAVSGDWETVGQIARQRSRSADNFEQLLGAGFRRAAIAAWQQDGVKYKVELIQYASDSADSAETMAQSATASGYTTLPDGLEGGCRAPDQQDNYADETTKYYPGIAITRRGDVVVRVQAFGDHRVDLTTICGLVKKQWERLG